MTCKHDACRVIDTRGYAGSVSVRRENRAAHGNVCHTDECTACGARRARNTNGMHEEIGEWGETRAQRQHAADAADAAAQALTRRIPPAVALTCGSNRVQVSIAADGRISTTGAAIISDEEIARALPALVDYARELRVALKHAERLRKENA